MVSPGTDGTDEVAAAAEAGAATAATAVVAKVEPGMPPEAGADAARAASGAAPAASAAVAATSTSPAEPPVPGDAMPSGMLQLRTTAASWVEVTDGRGQPLVSRVLKAGEAVGVDGAAPFRVRIGNAAATELFFRGQPTDLTAFTRDNVARLELR